MDYVPVARRARGMHNNCMTHKIHLYAMGAVIGALIANRADACTGITLKSTNGDVVVARTMDWSRELMDNMYVVVPRGHTARSLLPDGSTNGMQFTSIFGYVGLGMEAAEFIVDGTNEAGLSAALFYFPGYGKYVDYDAKYRDLTIADLQLVSWILSQFSTIDQFKAAVQNVRIVHVDPRADTVHWRITEPSGRQVILEIIDGKPVFYESELGVLTNSPGYPWHLLNLNNYLNLHPGSSGPTKLGPLTLRAFGAGSGFLGMPGDMTPPSRFVRASFFQTYSIPQPSAFDSAMQAFHILNNFDVPLGIQFPDGQSPTNMPSATQWTIATDMTNHIIYFHTMYDRTLRSIDLKQIDFTNVKFQSHKLATDANETIVPAFIE